VTAVNVREVLLSHVDPSAPLMTDEAGVHKRIGRPFAGHDTVEHGKGEYVRGEAHINSAESFFSRLKRQLYGTPHAVSKRHLHRYVAEVAFKHNTRWFEDGERVVRAIHGADGKRLRYKRASGVRHRIPRIAPEVVQRTEPTFVRAVYQGPPWSSSEGFLSPRPAR
jgi:hypothetical protein